MCCRCVRATGYASNSVRNQSIEPGAVADDSIAPGAARLGSSHATRDFRTELGKLLYVR